jgi:predicted SnoaL-like aldol condensation-catalyzing enzyme
MNAEYETLVRNYFAQLYSPMSAAAISTYLADGYIEHQYTAAFSVAGLRAYVDRRLAENANHRVIIHKVLSDDNMVFLLVEEKLDNGIDVARAELFRIDQGKIVEHWGAQVIDEKNRKNSNGTFDGPQPNRSVDYARKAAARFLELDLRGFDGQEIQCFYESRAPGYKQHSPKGGDGLEGLLNILRKMKESGQKMIMQPKRTLIDGDFIVCHRLYDSSPKHPLVNRINTFDLFRMDVDGKAVEHWDVMEDVPSMEMLTRMF